MRRPKAALLIAAAFSAAGVAWADPSPEDRLDTVQKAIQQNQARQDEAQKTAEALAAEIASLQQQSVDAAKAEQDREASATDAEARRATLASDAAAKRQALEHDAQQQGRLLMALARMATMPEEAVALAPRPPIDTARGAILMGRAVPVIAERSAGLERDIAALDATRQDLDAANANVISERQALAAEQARLQDLLARKTTLMDSENRTIAANGKRLAALASEAGNLRDLVAKAEAERQRADDQRALPKGRSGAEIAVAAPAPLRLDPDAARKPRPFAEAKGAMDYPVTGLMVARFGSSDGLGGESRGLTFETRPGAVVVAPFDGQIAFAGPFRGYGQILIIAHGDGYHSLVAGLDSVDGKVGQWLVAGEPIGKMSGAVEKPRLYLELRHNNQPIDPAPWLTTRVEKANG